jgi:hypothetical protein
MLTHKNCAVFTDWLVARLVTSAHALREPLLNFNC